MDSEQSSVGRSRMLSKEIWTAGVLCAVGGAGSLVIGLLAPVIRPHSVAFALMQVPWIIVQFLQHYAGKLSCWFGSKPAYSLGC
jgi:hypothetical protein